MLEWAHTDRDSGSVESGNSEDDYNETHMVETKDMRRGVRRVWEAESVVGLVDVFSRLSTDAPLSATPAQNPNSA